MECGLKVFENGVRRGIFGAKWDEGNGSARNCILGSLVICTAYRILVGWSDREECDGVGM